MSYFDEASLVLVPSGYKDQKIYSIKPLDGSGDLTFSRASSATRVASNGLIEKVRTNLALYSQDFSDATWYKELGNSVTANTIANPLDGVVNADTITATATNAINVNQLFTAAATSEYTYSIYLKKNNHDFIQPYIFSGGGFAARIEINLTDGTFTTLNGSGATVTSVGNGWYRATLIASLSSSATFTTGVLTSSTTGSRSVYVFGAQLETGVATDYIATTTAAVSVGPVSGLPRLDYLNSTCPRLLLEPQRTNLTTDSETFAASTGTTISLNNTASPDGYVNADKLVEDTSTGVHQTFWVTSLGGSVDSSAYCISVFVKAAGRSRILVYDNNQTASGATTFDLSTGTIVSGGGKIENYGSGWYRCTIFPLKNFSTTSSAFIQLISTGTTTSYTGNGTSGVFLWGKQVEVGAYATSYIPTLGTSVTRVADMSGTTDYFGAQTFAGNFTFFVDLLPMEGNTGTGDAMILGGGDYTGGGNFQSYFRFASGNIILRGVAEALLIERNYTMTANQQYKILVTRTGTTVKIFANGAQVGASATSSTSVILRSLGWSYIQAAYNYDGRINQVLLMPSGLTDAQAIELTTL